MLIRVLQLTHYLKSSSLLISHWKWKVVGLEDTALLMICPWSGLYDSILFLLLLPGHEGCLCHMLSLSDALSWVQYVLTVKEWKLQSCEPKPTLFLYKSVICICYGGVKMSDELLTFTASVHTSYIYMRHPYRLIGYILNHIMFRISILVIQVTCFFFVKMIF